MNVYSSEKGYSARVQLELRADGKTLELASIAPTKVVLRQPAELPPCNAEVVMFIDESVSIWPVRIPSGAVPFDLDVTTQSRGEMQRIER